MLFLTAEFYDSSRNCYGCHPGAFNLLLDAARVFNKCRRPPFRFLVATQTAPLPF